MTAGTCLGSLSMPICASQQQQWTFRCKKMCWIHRWTIAITFAFLLARVPLVSTANDTSAVFERSRRFISYPINGGIAKIVLGFLAPVRFHHPLTRSLNCGLNVQANYAIPSNIIFPRPESVFQNRQYTDNSSGSRKQLYEVLEKVLRVSLGAGPRARQCLLRTVCEVADTPLKHNGLVGELLDVVFTPQPSDELSPKFLKARRYGAKGLDCSRIYSRCAWGYGLLDRVTRLFL
ncbi:uncharacterized protein LOC118460883 [Anopheles albimanus]|uniref:uncharacterized protein LOC118460883 n=1 Tax=Anopheles albimanus TaxID=7167 RepID=UPI00163FDBAD|nr:uncharacterized protein LOC118460883 [Anopheles albimanus]